MTSRQIEKDLLRTLPTNVCYSNVNSTGIPRLRRILRGLAWLYPDIGYCQVCNKHKKGIRGKNISRPMNLF